MGASAPKFKDPYIDAPESAQAQLHAAAQNVPAERRSLCRCMHLAGTNLQYQSDGGSTHKKDQQSLPVRCCSSSRALTRLRTCSNVSGILAPAACSGVRCN